MGFREIWAGLLCSLAFAAPAAAQGSWPEECKLVAAASLPFHLEGNHIAVDVQVNGIPRVFQIDTGGFTSSISEAVAAQMHLPQFAIRPGERILDAGGVAATHYTKVDSLLIGNLDAKDIRLMVMEGGLEGLIAPDLLRNFDVEIDFPNRTINFFRPHPCPGKAVYWTDKFSAIAIDVTRQGHIRVPVELNGLSLEALLDTGAPVSLLDAQTARRRLAVEPQGSERKMTGASGGEVMVSDTPFDSLKIGDTVLQHPHIGLSSDKQETFFDKAAEETSLILGMREMSKFHIYIAYRERKLYLSEESSAPAAAVTVTAATLEPAEAIAAAKRAAPSPFAGTFSFQIQSTRRGNGQLFLNSEVDFRDPANLSVLVPLAEAATLGADDGLKGKHVTVIGGARLVRVQPLQDGKPAGEPQLQVRIPVTSASQVSITP